jgi:hypothetical protein
MIVNSKEENSVKITSKNSASGFDPPFSDTLCTLRDGKRRSIAIE